MFNEEGITDRDESTSPLMESGTPKTDEHLEEPAATAVLNYLRKRGLGSAILELQRHIDDDTNHKKPKTDENLINM